MKTVTFCGHSKLTAEETNIIKEKLYVEIEKLILQGATEFLLGGYGAFDELCAKTVKKLKEKYPHIASVLVVPYIDRYYNKDLYDASEYPALENVPKRFAVLKRNEYMVQKSEIVVAYVKFNFGGAAGTLEYARKKNKVIILINDK